MASHLDTVRNDIAYSDILANWDAAFYDKFTNALRPTQPQGRALDVGCGVGQVVARLSADGVEAHGVDVAEANIARAQKISTRCVWYNGTRLPYPDRYFDSVGALNVLEHVQEPEAFIAEVARVTSPNGRVIISSPNFFRFLGWQDYHPHMRGISQKLRNLRYLVSQRSRMKSSPDSVCFTRMKPIIKEPFTPDDDAIVATNSLDIAFFLNRNGCQIETVACTDRIVPTFAEWALNCSPLKYGLFNAFVVARKR